MANDNNLKVKLAVSGAAETGVCCPDITDLAYELGKTIARHNCILVTGATSGAPLWVAKGAKQNNGTVIGFSPALNEEEHLKVFALPTDYHDVIFWTGLGYSGRNLILSRATEGIIIICGRIGTINEFTTAFEDKKPIGVLLGSGGNADELLEIVERSGRKHPALIWDKEPQKLVDALLEIIKSQAAYKHTINLEKI